MDYIKIGRVINTHGIKGELKIRSSSDFDEERYGKGNTVYIMYEGKYVPMICDTYRVHKGFPLVSFQDHKDINLVEKYKNCDVYIDAAEREELDDGRHYVDELIGMTAVADNGDEIGEVMDVEETLGANDNLRIRKKDGKEVLVPYVPAFIQKVDDEAGVITIHVIEGLL
jgi:16S rRNA processing protein RimM